jgi:hypothetical protein
MAESEASPAKWVTWARRLIAVVFSTGIIGTLVNGLGYWQNIEHVIRSPEYRLRGTGSLVIGQTAKLELEAVYPDGTRASTDLLPCSWLVTPSQLPVPLQPDGCTLAITNLPAYFPDHGAHPIDLLVTVAKEGQGFERIPLASGRVRLYPIRPPMVEAKSELAFGASMLVGYRLEGETSRMSFTCTWYPIMLYDNANNCRPTFIAPTNSGDFPSGLVPIHVSLIGIDRGGDIVADSSTFTIRLIRPENARISSEGPQPEPFSKTAAAQPSAAMPDANYRSAFAHPAHGAAMTESTLHAVAEAGGLRRVAILRDRVSRLPSSQRISIDDALQMLGDLPAPDLRRSGLDALLPRLELPISPANTIRLIDGFVGNARAAVLLDLEACITRPIGAAMRNDLLQGLDQFYHDALDADLRGWAECPLTRRVLSEAAAGTQEPTVYGLTEDTFLRKTPEEYGLKIAPLESGSSTVRKMASSQSDPVWAYVQTPDGQTGYVEKKWLAPQ